MKKKTTIDILQIWLLKIYAVKLLKKKPKIYAKNMMLKIIKSSKNISSKKEIK